MLRVDIRWNDGWLLADMVFNLFLAVWDTLYMYTMDWIGFYILKNYDPIMQLENYLQLTLLFCDIHIGGICRDVE